MKRIILALTALLLTGAIAISLAGCAINKGGEPGSSAGNTAAPGTGEPFVARSLNVSNFSFDAEMMRYVELTQTGNYMISPLSFKYALGMLIAQVPRLQLWAPCCWLPGVPLVYSYKLCKCYFPCLS